jgi:hypothetical protein
MATAMPMSAPIYCQRHFSSGPLLINIHTRVTRTLTFIITILFSFCSFTLLRHHDHRLVQIIYHLLASLQYSLVRRSYRKHLPFLDNHHRRLGYRCRTCTEKGNGIKRQDRPRCPRPDCQGDMDYKEVWWEAYIRSVLYTGSLMRGLYTLSILHRKFDERPIYAQYFTQEVWWEAYINTVFYWVSFMKVGDTLSLLLWYSVVRPR